MRLKVRRGGISALVVLFGAGLLSTSTSVQGVFAESGRTLNLRVPTSNPNASGFTGTVAAWIVSRSASESLRAAHVLTAEAGRLEEGASRAGQIVLVRLTVGRGSRRLVLTNAATVADLLGVLRVRVHRLDVVKPSPDVLLGARTRVRVIRVHQARKTETVELPYQTLTQYSTDLPAGQINVLTLGAPGLARLTYLITYRNGTESSRHVLAELVLASPVDQVEQKGTGAVDVSHGSQIGDATWYDWYGCGDGHHAAHKTLPFGTEVTVTNLDNGQAVTVTINDRGPYGSGRIIDLCPTAFSAIAPLGQGVAHVEITW